MTSLSSSEGDVVRVRPPAANGYDPEVGAADADEELDSEDEGSKVRCSCWTCVVGTP